MQAHIQKLTLEIEHGRMIIQPPKYNLDEMLKDITPKNRHHQILDGEQRGNEERMVRYAPKPGDIVWLEFDLQKGKEIQKTRPALTIHRQSEELVFWLRQSPGFERS